MIAHLFLEDFLDRVRKKYFPIVTFAIGQGEKRYKNRGKITYAIITVLVIPIVMLYLPNILSFIKNYF